MTNDEIIAIKTLEIMLDNKIIGKYNIIPFSMIIIAHIICPKQWNIADTVLRVYIDIFLIKLNNITIIDESKKPDNDNKNEFENKPLNITPTNNTRSMPIEKYSFLP